MSEKINAAKVQLDKILAARSEKPSKTVDLFEKSPCDIDFIIHVAAASGRLSALTSVLLNLANQEQGKDAVLGLCFLVLFRMCSLFGVRPVFKDIPVGYEIKKKTFFTFYILIQNF